MTGPETLYAELTSGDPGTIGDVRDSIDDSMTSLDSSADSLVLATSGVTWKGLARESYNQRIWATKAMAEMAHLRCSQGKIAVKSVRRAYVAMERDATASIGAWRKNKANAIDGPTLLAARRLAMRELRTIRATYSELLTAATDYLPTDELAQGEGGREAWEEYLRTGGLSDAEREALEKGLGYSMTYGLGNGTLPGPLVPDTEVTGNDDGWTPQGVGYSPAGGGTMVQVSYGGDGDDRAVASIIDPDTGEVINTVELGGSPHHVGSVVVDGNDVWVTSGSPSETIRYSLPALRRANLGTPVEPTSTAPLADGGHSYSTIHTDPDGTTYLYAGDFWDDRMYRYVKTADGWERDPDYEVKTPEFTQGVVVRDGEIAFSTSYGRGYESELMTYDRATLEDGGDAAGGDGHLDSTYLPNMSEGVTETPYGFAVTHESGSADYLGTGDEWVSPFMTVVPPGEAGADGAGVEMDPATLRAAARKLGRVETELGAAARAIDRIRLPASALGEVPAGPVFAKALNKHLDATSIWLGQSEISAGISIDGLLGSATEHERADTFWRDLYEQDRERLGLADKGKAAWDKTQELAGEARDTAEEAAEKAGEVVDDVTPWDGTLPGV